MRRASEAAAAVAEGARMDVASNAASVARRTRTLSRSRTIQERASLVITSSESTVRALCAVLRRQTAIALTPRAAAPNRQAPIIAAMTRRTTRSDIIAVAICEIAEPGG